MTIYIGMHRIRIHIILTNINGKNHQMCIRDRTSTFLAQKLLRTASSVLCLTGSARSSLPSSSTTTSWLLSLIHI